MSAPTLRWDPDPEVWFVGPTDERPYRTWHPEAVKLVKRLFEVSDDQKDIVQYITAILERIGADTDPDWLPYRLIGWPVLEQIPFVVSYGLVQKHPDLEDYLVARGQGVVEAPIVVETTREDGGTARRAVAYYEDARGLMINVRVLVDFGDDDVVALVDSATRDPKVLAAFLDDVDRFVTGLSLDRGRDR
ncbi:hypothetical protein [Aeromicrobium wangtongii]|uniref:hypothetical protein n=1 Tax=Aeromicrobium wangtongii TaxID=2969247 RepID=UPI00201714DA|nr:hypothetical protein [Aeromicrobium wangtongii]MCL3819509.1 hypothetical protein [Aeromicrobium wangtongii]